jgi:nitrogen regulatory protein PII
MQPLKKIEIVLSQAELPKLARLANQYSLHYTVYHHATGRGDRGERADDDLTGVFGNVCFMTAIEPERLPPLIEAIRPLLKTSGGLCLVSDVLGVRH